MSIKRAFGWKPDQPEHISLVEFTDVSKFAATRLPVATHNAGFCDPVVRDQYGTSACTGFAFTGAAHSRLRILGYDPQLFSPRHTYGVGRMLARDSKDESLIDDGAIPFYVGGGIKEFGFALESAFPFTDDPRAINEEPDLATFQNASQFRLQNFSRIGQTGLHRRNAVMRALAAGEPVPIGMQVGQKFMDHNGDFPLGIEADFIGGHMTYLIDYEDDGEVFIGVNSWGLSWGYKGLYKISAERLMHSSTSDLYNMVIVSGT